MDDHFGFKRGQMHLFCSTSGAGKSTLTRSIVLNMVEHGAKVLVLSSEETLEDYKYKLIKAGVMPDFITRNLRFIHERDIFETNLIDQTTMERFFFHFDEVLSAIPQLDLIVYDNITTSPFYTDIRLSMNFLSELYKIINNYQVALAVVAHTAAGVRQSDVDVTPECVRGSKQVGLRAEYFYFLRRLESVTGRMRNIIEVKKARAFGEMNRYELDYSGMFHKYMSDQRMEAGEYFDVLNSHRRRSTGAPSKKT
jgi:archaellum biogenesis ATPase FlaH